MNTLYYGDNLDILRRYVKDETVDLTVADLLAGKTVDFPRENVTFKKAPKARSPKQENKELPF